MDLYKEARNKRLAVLFPVVGLVMALIFAVIVFIPAGEGTRINGHAAVVGKSLLQQNPLMGFWFLCLGAPSVLAIMTLFGFALAFSTRVTREEIISTSKLGEWLPRLAWRVPVQSIVEVSLVDYELVAQRLEQEGAGKGARIMYVGNSRNEKDFRNAVTVSGNDIPLRVRRAASDTHGIMLVLSDGSSLFFGFQDPEKALAAIQQAMGSAA